MPVYSSDLPPPTSPWVMEIRRRRRRRRRRRTYIDVRALVQSQAAGLAVHKEHFYDGMWPIDAEARQLSH